MLSHPPVLNKILGNSQTRGMWALAPVSEFYERILPILDHVRIQTFWEGIHKFVEVAHNGVVYKPPHESNHVSVFHYKDQVRAPPPPLPPPD